MYKPSRMLILLTAMSVLLPVLAALQYYWLGQVSEAASERMRISLRASATRFRQDFNREFIRAYLNFHINSSAPPAEMTRYHLERLELWNKTAPYPQLISSVSMVDADEDGNPRLSNLNAIAKRFELTEWSGELLNLRDRFEQRFESGRLSPMSPRPLESFAEDIPALIVPLPSLSADKVRSQGSPPPQGFTIINLDLNYITRDFIPSLIQRNFVDDSHTGYNLAVTTLNHPERVIYSSGYPLTDFASSDVSTRIFGFGIDDIGAFLRSENAASPAGAEQTGARQLRLLPINIRLLKGPDGGSSTPLSDDGRWQLLIKHQAGSLAAAVSSARHRNLAISFGILLLLGTGIVMTAISTRRAERLARQQINFVAGVTHELRTPLAVICSAGENLADGVVNSPRKVAHYGEVIYKEGRRLTEMVEQALEFAGAQSGRRGYDLQSTEVADFIDGALAACQAQIEERGFNVETVIEPNLPPVRGDGAALKRAMQNLISNAIKYDGESRWARVSAQMLARKQGNEIRITIEDRGLGISTSDIAHIFEPFYRGQEAVATQIKGSGVGLSLVKQIVEAHGGRVSVKSRPGTGSVFTLHLPIATQAGYVKNGGEQL